MSTEEYNFWSKLSEATCRCTQSEHPMAFFCGEKNSKFQYINCIFYQQCILTKLFYRHFIHSNTTSFFQTIIPSPTKNAHIPSQYLNLSHLMKSRNRIQSPFIIIQPPWGSWINMFHTIQSRPYKSACIPTENASEVANLNSRKWPFKVECIGTILYVVISIISHNNCQSL